MWNDLVGGDAVRAYRAVWALAVAPEKSIPFLRVHLRPVPKADKDRLARLLADLDSEEFVVRKKAREELERLGEAATSFLVEASKNPPSAEVGRQVKELLDLLKAQRRTLSGERLRALRAVEALEYAATPEAREVLNALTKGEPASSITQAAQGALRRLAMKDER